MRPSPKYRSKHAGIHVSLPNQTSIPLGPLTQVDMRDHAGRKGKCRNKVGMWGNLSPYYSNAVTIDARWHQTVTNRSA